MTNVGNDNVKSNVTDCKDEAQEGCEVSEFESGFYVLLASKAIFRVRTYSRIT